MVIAKGQSRESMIPSPIMTAMEQGVIGRFEELTRSTSDVQDALISILSREVRLHPRARRRQHRLRQARLLHHRHRQQPRPGRQRPVLGAEAAVQLRPHPGGDEQEERGGDRPLPHRASCCAGTGSSWTCRRRCSTSCCRASPTCAPPPPRPSSDDEKLESALSTAEQIGVLEDAILHSHFFGDRTLPRRDARRLAGRLAGPAQPGGPGHPQQVLARRGRAAQQGGGRRLAGVPRGRPRGDRHPVMTRHPAEPAHVVRTALREQLQRGRRARSPAGPDAAGRASSPGMVDDVDRALREPLEIFPVCHHSPASALAMARRLREKQPKVIYLELCEDLRPLLDELRNCRLPVALQAFAAELDGFPAELGAASAWSRRSPRRRPSTRRSPTRSTPRASSWSWSTAPPTTSSSGRPRADAAEPPRPTRRPDAGEEAALHGDAVGVEIGDLRPRFAELEEHLLRHGKVRHWSEWWDQYVEQPLGDADYDTYRQVMVLIGSLFRRLRPATPTAVRIGRGPRALHVDADARAPGRDRRRPGATACTSAAPSTRPAGSRSSALRRHAGTFEISPRTGTRWLYGLIPSSHSAIEAQFGLAARLGVDRRGDLGQGGEAHAASSRTGWRARRAREAAGEERGRRRRRRRGREPAADRLSGFLPRPPAARRPRRGRAARLVRGHRPAGPPQRLPGQHRRRHRRVRDVDPAGRDARPGPAHAVRLPGRGGHLHREGHRAGPPGRAPARARSCSAATGSARSATTRCRRWPATCTTGWRRSAWTCSSAACSGPCSTCAADPELRPLLRPAVDAAPPAAATARPGRSWASGGWASGRSRRAGTWRSARHQRALIELGYEGVTIEQVLEQRLRRAAYGPQATAATVAGGRRGRHRCTCAAAASPTSWARARWSCWPPSAASTTRPRCCAGSAGCWPTTGPAEPALPAWCESFVTTGYAHYCTLLPTAFADEDAGGAAGRGDARLPVQHGEPGAVARLRPDPAGAGRRRSRIRRTPAKIGAAVGGAGAARPCCRGPSCGRGATSCWPTRWWCPPYPALPERVRARAGAGAGAGGRSSWRRCRTRSRGCPTRCCCRGCRR